MELVTLKDDLSVGIKKDQKIIDLKKGYALYLNKYEKKSLDDSKTRSEFEIPNDMTKFIKKGEQGIELARKTLEFLLQNKESLLKCESDMEIGPPVPFPPKDLICLARNYPAYVEKGGMEMPEFPLPFMKARSSIIGPGGHVIFHPLAEEVNHEVELSIVIGKGGRNIPENTAMEHIYGYTIMDEITASNIVRMYNRRGQCLGKSFYTFAPMGPSIVLKDQITDPHNLDIELYVDGKKIMEGNTKDMIFKIPEIIVFLSSVLELESGDIIATGTPMSVGPMRYGQVCEARIKDIGVLRYKIG